MRGSTQWGMSLLPLMRWRGAACRDGGLRFEIRWQGPPDSAPVAGRLFVMLTQREGVEPRTGPSWFRPEPFFAIDVEGFGPGQTRWIDARADGFPTSLSDLPPGTYRAQAVLHHSLDSPRPGTAVGNFHSEPVTIEVPSLQTRDAAPWVFRLSLTRRIPPREPLAREWGREILVPSPSLTAFHGRPVEHRAMVLLPPSYWSRAARRFPVIYAIPGFGGSHRSRQWQRLCGSTRPQRGQAEFIRVMLSGKCDWGHHAFANSATNGPRGDALVHELIPAIDRQFRTIPRAGARFLTGHSSGGWAALWLQVRYPDVFGGAWGIAPDPVDFRAFQSVDIYSPSANFYRDASGARRPLARVAGRTAIWCDDFCRMDQCLGRGGQMRSFEAVFSPLDAWGNPRPLFDRDTGQVDPETARAWQAFDLRLVLQRDWDRLKPLLQGRLHILVGRQDHFFLDNSVRRFQTVLEMDGGPRIEFASGADHMSVLSPARAARRVREMSSAYRVWLKRRRCSSLRSDGHDVV